jgi:hypothetical protein
MISAMELALDLGLEGVQNNAKHNSIRNAKPGRFQAAPSQSRRRHWQRRRIYQRAVFGSAAAREGSWLDESQFAVRPPIETPDELIFPLCVFCGYGRSHEAEFGKFNRMSCEAEIYCHDGCAIEDLMLDERTGD